MDPRAEFEAFLRFLHDHGVGLRGPGYQGSYEPGEYEERRLADAYELAAASSRNESSAKHPATVAASAPDRPSDNRRENR